MQQLITLCYFFFLEIQKRNGFRFVEYCRWTDKFQEWEKIGALYDGFVIILCDICILLGVINEFGGKNRRHSMEFSIFWIF